MKKIITVILMAMMILTMSNAVTKGIDNGIEYKIYKSSNEYDLRTVSKLAYISKNLKGSSLANDKKALKRMLRIIAKETKKDGYGYFVLLNRDINNLNGSPINRVNDLARYISLKKRNSSYFTDGRLKKGGVIRNSKIDFLYMPITSKQFKNSYISVWSVKQTLKDTK